MVKIKELTASQYKDALQNYKDVVSCIKTELGASFSDPYGFSKFLFVGANTDVGYGNLFQAIDKADFPLTAQYPGKEGTNEDSLRRKAYQLSIKTFFEEMSDGKIFAYRGLHGIEWNGLSSFLSSYKAYQKARAAQATTEQEHFDNYSLNSVVSILFALKSGGSWGIARVKTPRKIPKSGVLIVSKLSVKDIAGWGSDSESGLANEAEIWVKPCDPKCVHKIFVLSNKKIGKLASQKSRKDFSLDARRLVHIRDEREGDYEISINPEVAEGHGAVISNIPSGYEWYEFDV